MALARHIRSERGISLIEVAVSGAVFAALVLALSPSMLNTRKAAALSENTSVATTLALDKIEDLRSKEPVHAELQQGTWSDPANPLRPDGEAGGIFNRSWTVTDNTPEFGVKRVEMQVSWRDRTGQSAVSLVTLVMP